MAEITIGKTVFIVPEKSSPCDLWKVYFNKLKKETGTENARMIWLITWSSNGSESCTTNADFNNWLQKNGIDVSSAVTRTVADISQIGGNVLGLGKSMTKMLSVGVPVLLSGVLVVVLILLVNTAKKTDATDVLALTPIGRASKLANATKLLNG